MFLTTRWLDVKIVLLDLLLSKLRIDWAKKLKLKINISFLSKRSNFKKLLKIKLLICFILVTIGTFCFFQIFPYHPLPSSSTRFSFKSPSIRFSFKSPWKKPFVKVVLLVGPKTTMLELSSFKNEKFENFCLQF